MMTSVDSRGQDDKGSKASLNVKVYPDMILGIANLVNER